MRLSNRTFRGGELFEKINDNTFKLTEDKVMKT